MSRIWTIKIILIILFTAIMIQSGVQFYGHRHYQLEHLAGPGVTRVEKLSKYCEGLEGTIADTHVFWLEGKEEGGKILMIANTHSNEPAAMLQRSFS